MVSGDDNGNGEEKRLRTLEIAAAVASQRFEGHEKLCADRYMAINTKLNWVFRLLALLIFVIFISDGSLLQVIGRLIPALAK